MIEQLPLLSHDLPPLSLRAVDAHWQTSIVPPWVAEIRALLARLDTATPAE